jgi:hypothetical protein
MNEFAKALHEWRTQLGLSIAEAELFLNICSCCAGLLERIEAGTVEPTETQKIHLLLNMGKASAIIKFLREPK